MLIAQRTRELATLRVIGSSNGTGLMYPYTSSNPLTSVAFNESTCVAGSAMDVTGGTFEVWYTDEHALALQVATQEPTENSPAAPEPDESRPPRRGRRPSEGSDKD